MKENEISVLKVEPEDHSKESILENMLEALRKAVDGYIDIIGLEHTSKFDIQSLDDFV